MAIPVNSSTKIQNVKTQVWDKMIEKQRQNPPKYATRWDDFCIARQRMIFDGKELQNDKTLDDYGILHESIVFMLLRLYSAYRTTMEVQNFQ